MEKTYTLNQNFYSSEIIAQLLENFSEYPVQFSDSNMTISGNSLEEIEEIFHESMNYYIALYNEKT